MIDNIRLKVATGQYEYSKHAVDQTIKRRIADHEVAEAIALQSLIIEDYPDESMVQAVWYSALRKQVGRCISSAVIQRDR